MRFQVRFAPFYKAESSAFVLQRHAAFALLGKSSPPFEHHEGDGLRIPVERLIKKILKAVENVMRII